MSLPTLVVLVGTRPEAIKLVSLVRALRAQSTMPLVVMSSGQHPAMVRASLAQWGLAPDVELPSKPTPGSLSAQVRWLRDQVRQACAPLASPRVIVQGDTSTAYAGALAAAAAGYELVHIEAGLRTADPMRPFPEELFRRRIAPLCDWHFAPTRGAARNLYAEGIDAERVRISGNTGIDALRLALADPSHAQDLAWRGRFRELLVLTLHRRENYGPRLEQICRGVLQLLDQYPDFGVVCPVHPNPAVGARVRRMLSAHPRVVLCDPLPYQPFVHLLAEARLVITDSGGIQEEAPYLGVPAVVARENTERPEAFSAGNLRLVAAEATAVVHAAQQLLTAPRPTAVGFHADAPFGDGRAGERIAQVLLQACAPTAVKA